MVATTTIALLSLHPLVDQPESMLRHLINTQTLTNLAISTYKVARKIAQTREHDERSPWSKRIKPAHIVKRMLIKRSQLQPVRKAAAAGGKRIATLHTRV